MNLLPEYAKQLFFLQLSPSTLDYADSELEIPSGYELPIVLLSP